MQTNGSTANADIDRTMEVCAEAIARVYEECAAKYEAAVAAEDDLHRALVGQLKAAAADCRSKGQAAAAWLMDRGKTAKDLLARADESVATLETPDGPSKDILP